MAPNTALLLALVTPVLTVAAYLAWLVRKT